MKQKDFHIYLTEQERSQVIQSLIELKNSLIAHGRYADAVDAVSYTHLDVYKRQY